VLILICALLGLLIGSFLNVVIARVPAGDSVVSPASRCPRCRSPIAARDNVPVVSWLLLRGRCRWCGTSISPRYPIVEAGTGIAFGAVAAWASAAGGTAQWPLGGHGLFHPAALVALIALLYLAAVSIVLALIDIDVKRLPFWIVVPSWWVGGTLLGVSALLAGTRGTAVRMLLGGLVLWGLYRLLHLIHPRGMAYGDVRLAGLIGGYLAWLGWMPLAVGGFLGFLLGGVGGAVIMALRGSGLKTQIPYGPYMLIGTWLALAWGQDVGAAYLRLTGL
jgi:leader peptidase (prepilin peptidase)/N-methyltransferase